MAAGLQEPAEQRRVDRASGLDLPNQVCKGLGPDQQLPQFPVRNAGNPGGLTDHLVRRRSPEQVL